MKEKNGSIDQHALLARNELKNDIQGYPIYPPDEDIYSKFQKDTVVNPEHISKIKESNEEEMVEIDTHNDLTDIDLDIPGSELDDTQEKIGSEDEENNYYSLGGDDHDDLDENKGE